MAIFFLLIFSGAAYAQNCNADSAYVTTVHPTGGRTYYCLGPNPNDTRRGAILTKAKTEAASGDTIMVGPGQAEAKNLLKNGVNWYLEDGAVIQNSTDNTVGVFDDGPTGFNGAVTCSVSGRGIIKNTTSGGTKNPVVYLSNSSSNLSFQAKRVEQGTNSAGGCIYHVNGIGYYRIDQIGSDTSNGSGVYWENGDTYVEADLIESNSGITVYAVPQPSPFPSNFWVRAKQILQNGTYGSYAIQSAGAEIGSKTWIEAETIDTKSTLLQVASFTANKTYITAQKINNLADVSVYNSNGLVWITAQKITAAATSGTQPLFKQGAFSSGVSHLNVMQWELLGNQACAVEAAGGTVFASGQVWHPGSGDGFKSSGGTLFVQNANISTRTGRYDLAQSGSGVLTATGTVYDVTKVSGTIRRGDPCVGVGPSLPADGTSYQFFRTNDGNIWGWNGTTWVRLNN